ncbi:hypothetical protein [Corynebacterium amycolatum]|uniref:hypothetical protein n=1 Tax=Corynebacterium amycolatum TaxID=43765 RepID=UPI00191E172A|nr:hypothetical protein [Corynebacterium amycolatum]QQU97779.1 hypothetical protein I6I65_10680 [Corynebacterium amycolatum]
MDSDSRFSMAVERELIEAGVRWRWVNDGTDRLTWDDVIALIATTGPDSALARHYQGDDWQWNLTNQLLAHIADQQTMSAWNGKGPKPKPIPRPGVGDEQQEIPGLKPEGLSRHEMDKWLGDDWPGIDGGG